MFETFYNLFIDKVDTELLKSIELKDLKASNVQDTNEVDFLHGGVNEGAVAHVHQVSEETSKHILDD